jgi:hypothetical protein
MNIQEYHNLTAKKPRKQIEGKHQIGLGGLLNGRLKPRLNPNLVFWTYSGSGEKKGIKTAVLQKRKGLQRGDFDYRFELRDGDILRIIYLETKTVKGSLTPEQRIFKARHDGLLNAKCYTSKSVEESVEILEKENILTKIPLSNTCI